MATTPFEFTEFVTVLLMLLACLRITQALLERHLGMMLVHMFAGGFYGTIALIGVSLVSRGV